MVYSSRAAPTPRSPARKQVSCSSLLQLGRGVAGTKNVCVWGGGGANT